MPFFFPFATDIAVSYYLSLGVALAALFGLGAFLGRISKRSMAVSGPKMIAAGFVSLLLSYVLEHR